MRQKTETNRETLARIQNGFSKNDEIVLETFMALNVPAELIVPRETVLTFKGWKAKGRSVAKGAIGIRITVYVPYEKTNPKTGEKEEHVRPKTIPVFHISQTVKEKGEIPAGAGNDLLFKYSSDPELMKLHKLA